MKTHYCKADKAVISYEGECNWCGEKEDDMKEELIELLKKHIKHSLCKTPISIQSRVYFDGEEISSLRLELPQTKPLTKEEIDDLVHEHNLLDDYPYDFVRAIEERHGIYVQKT